MQKKYTVFGCAVLLSACAAPPKYDYVKEGVSEHEKTNASSECQYQIRLSKAPVIDAGQLLKLCMQGKGFRLRHVN